MSARKWSEYNGETGVLKLYTLGEPAVTLSFVAFAEAHELMLAWQQHFRAGTQEGMERLQWAVGEVMKREVNR